MGSIGRSSLKLFSTKEDDHYLHLVQDELRHWEYSTQTFWISESKKSATIVDVGAYLGVYSILASSANPEAQVIAFEPNPATVTSLRRNVKLNAMDDKITIIGAAAGDSRKSTPMFHPVGRPQSSGASLDEQNRGWTSIMVNQIPMDEIVEKADLIKIDAEEHEPQVLLGARSLLKNSRPKLVIEVLTIDKFHELQNLLAEFGYAPKIFFGRRREPAQTCSEFVASGNYLFTT